MCSWRSALLHPASWGPGRTKTDDQGGDYSVHPHSHLSWLGPSPASKLSGFTIHPSYPRTLTISHIANCGLGRDPSPMKPGPVGDVGEGERLEEWWSSPFPISPYLSSPLWPWSSDNRRIRYSQGSGHCLSCCPLWSGRQRGSVEPTSPWGPMELPGASAA